MSTEDLYQELDPIREPRKVYLRTTALLEKNFGYTDPRILGKGSFGSVIRFNNPKNEDGVAVKLLNLSRVKEGERSLWIRLRHENIVPLQRLTMFPTLNTACFEMQICPNDLLKVVRMKEFLKSPESLTQLKTWIYQVLCGLDFLHYKNLCHLDLKSDNVLISRRSSRAMISDFTFLSKTTSPIRSNIGLPRMYRPPEAFQILKPFESLNGRAFDRWTVGVMAFELLTNFHMIGSISCRHLGTELRYASMRGALQKQAFAEKMQSALPAVELIPDDVQMARDFIHSFLKVEPTARMTAEVGMSHKFLGYGDVVNDEVDALWQRPNPTSESICGPTIYQSNAPIKESNCRRRITKWVRRRCSALSRMFRRCLPCVR